LSTQKGALNMDDEIMRALGFGVQVDLRNEGRCPFCKSEINPSEFINPKSFKEFTLSGLCQKCQDETFLEIDVNDDQSLESFLEGETHD